MRIKVLENKFRKFNLGKPEGSKAHQNFGLTNDEFEKMLQKMIDGDDSLFEQVFLSQFEDCISYLMNRYKISRSLAYDVSMDALLKFRKRLLDRKIVYGNMRFLFTKMASQYLSETRQYQPLTFAENLLEEKKVEIDDGTLDSLDKSWSQLGEPCRILLDKFYYQKIALKILSNQLGKSEVAIRKQKQRCLEKLRFLFLEQINR